MANCRAEEGTSNRRRIEHLPIVESFGIPTMQNGLVTVALLSFVGAWNNFFFPLIVLSQENLYPLTSRTQHLEQRGLRSRWETGLQLNRFGLVDQRATAANRICRFRQILASRLNGGRSRGLSAIKSVAPQAFEIELNAESEPNFTVGFAPPRSV
jgi:hypothetical protein